MTVHYHTDKEDNQGNLVEIFDSYVNVPQIPDWNTNSCISESLYNSLLSGPVEISGPCSQGVERTWRVEINGKFINATLLKFGFPTGTKLGIAINTDRFGWCYTKKTRELLEMLTSEDHWLAKIHLFYRV